MEMINNLVNEHIETVEAFFDENMVKKIHEMVKIIKNSLTTGHKILLCGNGGSAADCQHIAAEFVGRFVKERQGIPAIALTVDTSILTAVGNDYGFDNVFSRQVEALAKHGDILIGISTSGNSVNVLNAVALAKSMGVYTIGLTGSNGGKMLGFCHDTIVVPTKTTARVQEIHILIGHILCELLDQ